jgi:uncharacterized membrane protein YphA (DoxX/SURF4 family)
MDLNLLISLEVGCKINLNLESEMEKINNFFDGIANPIRGVADWLLRLGLGISFFLHGYGKLPLHITDNGKWLTGEFGTLVANLITYGEILAGLGIVVGGLLAKPMAELGHLVTRMSGGAVGIIMIGAIFIAHSDWLITKKLFMSEQIFLFLLGTYFAIKGNR